MLNVYSANTIKSPSKSTSLKVIHCANSIFFGNSPNGAVPPAPLVELKLLDLDQEPSPRTSNDERIVVGVLSVGRP